MWTVLVAAAVCPHPPLLVPELATGKGGGLGELRQHCDRAVAGLLAAEPDAVIVLGGGSHRRFTAADHGSFARYGMPDVRTSLAGPPALLPATVGASNGRIGLPLPVLVGSWLLDRAGATVRRSGQTVPAVTDPAGCAELGRRLAGTDERVALLVMGDGSARRGTSAPGYHDDRAEPFDTVVAAALGTADLDALAGLDPALADQLLVAGRAPWQVLAGAAAGRGWRAELRYHDAPYGVGYFVANWWTA